MSDEDFTLGSFSVEDDFSLGSLEFEPEERKNENINKTEETNDAYSFEEKEEVKRIYELLVEGKTQKVKFKESFYNNVNIFEVAGKKPFEILSSAEYNSFCEKIDKWIAIANYIWRGREEDRSKIIELNDALEELKGIFKFEKLTKDYSNAIKKNLLNELAKSIYSKFQKDKVLDIFEVLDSMDYAISIKYTSDRETAKKTVTTLIQKFKEKYDFTIESYEDTFLQSVQKKEKLERLNTEQTKQKLFKEYKPLAELNSQVLLKELSTDEVLYDEMVSLLTENDLLIPNTDFFILDFLEPEIERQKGHYDFNYPINTEYFYYLKGTALNIYQLTDEQWREIAMIRNIIPEDAATVAFIMGDKKESSINGIANLLKENPETSYARIMAGDLETYFTHIGRKSIATKINSLKKAYSTNTTELITGIVNLLAPVIDNPPEPPKPGKNFNELIKNGGKLNNLVKFIVEHKSEETLYNELITESLTSERLHTLFSSKEKKYSYTKFLLNVLYELLLENDISQYKYAFIKIATKIQELLKDKEDFATFMKVYVPIVNAAVKNNIISSSDEIDGFLEIEKLMNQIFDSEYETQNNKTKKKSMFGLFKKGE